MAVKRLLFDYEFDFDLLAISAISRSYKLAWEMNRTLQLQLEKQPEHTLVNKSGDQLQLAYFEHATDNTKIVLLENRLYKGNEKSRESLLPEMAKIDYFLKIHGDIFPHTLDNLALRLKTIESVTFVTRIDPKKIKSKENLLYI